MNAEGGRERQGVIEMTEKLLERDEDPYEEGEECAGKEAE